MDRTMCSAAGTHLRCMSGLDNISLFSLIYVCNSSCWKHTYIHTHTHTHTNQRPCFPHPLTHSPIIILQQNHTRTIPYWQPVVRHYYYVSSMRERDSHNSMKWIMDATLPHSVKTAPMLLIMHYTMRAILQLFAYILFLFLLSPPSSCHLLV